MAKLVIFRGDAVETELHLGRQTVRVGRDARNDIVLDDKTVTRFHAEVIPEGSTYYIADLNSRNGVWVDNQRIKGKTPLALGVPVTVGAYELTLEDDIGTSDLSEELPGSPATIMSTSAVPVLDRASASPARGRSATPTSAAAAAARKPAVFWTLLAVATLFLCAVTYVAVRRFTARPAPPREVAVATPIPVPVEVAPTPTAAPTPVTQDIVAGYMEAAQFAIDDRDYEAARDDVDAALELDPTNQELLARKKQVEGLLAAPPPLPAKPAPPKPVVPEVQEIRGIPRRADEAAADYTARAGRVQANMREGLRNLDQEDFAAAITRFRAVERDQTGYQNVDTLIADAAARQKKAVDAAISNGQENERAGNLVNAVRWYENAFRLDPGSTAAQERLAAVADRRTKQGLEALKNADVFRKRNDIAKAVAAYQEAAYLLPSTNEKKAEAQQWLEKLKQ